MDWFLSERRLGPDRPQMLAGRLVLQRIPERTEWAFVRHRTFDLLRRVRCRVRATTAANRACSVSPRVHLRSAGAPQCARIFDRKSRARWLLGAEKNCSLGASSTIS